MFVVHVCIAQQKSQMVRMGSRSAAYQAAIVGRSGSMSSQLDWSVCEPMTDCASGREMWSNQVKLAMHTCTSEGSHQYNVNKQLFMYMLCIVGVKKSQQSHERNGTICQFRSVYSTAEVSDGEDGITISCIPGRNCGEEWFHVLTA